MWKPVNFALEDDPKELPFNVTVEQARKCRKNVYILTNRSKLFPKELVENCDGMYTNLDNFSDDEIKSSIFFIYFSRGDFSIPYIDKIIRFGGGIISPHIYGKVPFWQNDKFFIESFNEIVLRLQENPKGSIEQFSAIAQAIQATKELKGDYVEIGVFSGASALAALIYMNKYSIKRKCYLLDTYKGFNYEDSKLSQDQKWHGTHTSWKGIKFDGENAMKRIVSLTEGLGHEVIPIEFNACRDELPDSLESIVVANIDVDMYEATLKSLEKVAPRIVKNGIITTEDPVSTHGLYGAYYALHKFLNSKIGKSFISLRTSSTYFLIKKE